MLYLPKNETFAEVYYVIRFAWINLSNECYRLTWTEQYLTVVLKQAFEFLNESVLNCDNPTKNCSEVFSFFYWPRRFVNKKK